MVCPIVDSSVAVVITVCSADQRGSATSSQGIRGCIAVLATVKFTYIVIKIVIFVKNSRGNSLIGDMFLSYFKRSWLAVR